MYLQIAFSPQTEATHIILFGKKRQAAIMKLLKQNIVFIDFQVIKMLERM